jgi:hypothetical protein
MEQTAAARRLGSWVGIRALPGPKFGTWGTHFEQQFVLKNLNF